MNNSYSNTLFYTILSHNFLAIHLHVLLQFFIIATMHKTAISFFYFLLLWYQVKGLETLLPSIIHSWDIFTSPLKSWIWEILLYTSAYIYILLPHLHQNIFACLIPSFILSSLSNSPCPLSIMPWRNLKERDWCWANVGFSSLSAYFWAAE